MIRVPNCFSAAVLIVAGLGACSSGASLPAPAPLEPATAEEAKSFGAELLANLQACDELALQRQFEMDAAGRQAMLASSLRGDALVEFAKGFEASFSRGLPQGMTCSGSDEAHYRIEGYREREGFPTVIVSELDLTMSVNEFMVGKNASGELVSRDYVDWRTGLSFQSDIATLINLLVEDYFRNEDAMAAIQAFNAGNGPEGSALLSTLSMHSKKNQKLMLSALDCLAAAGFEQYWQYRKTYRNTHKTSLEPYFFDMAASLGVEEWGEALKALDAWDGEMGGLPGLRLTRARLLSQGGDMPSAIALYRKLASEEPNDEQLLIELVSVLVDGKDYDAAVVTAKVVFENSGTYWDQDGGEEAEWQDFMATPQWAEYQEWLSPRLAALEADPEEG